MGRGRRNRECYTMAEAAADGRIIMVRCGRCRRTAYFLAADLARVLGGTIPAIEVPFACSRCGTALIMRVISSWRMRGETRPISPPQYPRQNRPDSPIDGRKSSHGAEADAAHPDQCAAHFPSLAD